MEVNTERLERRHQALNHQAERASAAGPAAGPAVS